MTWHSLTHGTNGLLFAYALTLLPLILALVQRRVGLGLVLLSPVLALPWTLVGMLAGSVVAYALSPHLAAGPWTAAASVAVLLSSGFAGGMLGARRRGIAEGHKRGTMVKRAARGAPSTPRAVA